jgi:hypothetical protein
MRGLVTAAFSTLAGALVLGLACNGGKGGDGSAPPDDELVVDELGDHAVSDTGGYIDVDVTIPAGAVSTMAWCGDWGDGGLGAVWKVVDGAGDQQYIGDQPDAGKFRSDYLDDLVPGLLPVSPDLVPSAGSWHFQWFVGRGSDGTATCGAVHRVDDVSDPASVFVQFVVVDAGGLDATTLPDDANWKQALDELETAWGAGRVTPSYSYVDFDGDAAKYSVVDIVGDDYSEFNDLLRTAAPESLRTITFFLVQEVSSDGATILGLSAGPPGAATLANTSKSGVIVTTADLAGKPEDVGKIMAHEGAHFLGLFHTTEKDGARSDPLGDTPECPISNDADGNGVVNSSECTGKGSDNLMWWTLSTGSGTLSDDQSFVLRSNPVAD